MGEVAFWEDHESYSLLLKKVDQFLMIWCKLATGFTDLKTKNLRYQSNQISRLKSGTFISVLVSFKFSSVQSCPTLCNPMNRSMPGLPVHHQLPEFTETHVHRVSDAIQPFHPLSFPSLPAPNPSQHQSFPMSQLFAWGSQSTGVSALASFLPKKSQGWSPYNVEKIYILELVNM